ncbi:MAG: O-antigen ligase family protein [Spirochaetia bacterium]|nr:O-antigen ligase family protein [Spirochaetia bacterium]
MQESLIMKASMLHKIFILFRGKVNIFLNYSFVVFAFVLPLSRSGISIMLVMITFLWIVEGNWNEKYNRLRHDKLVKSFGLYFGFLIVSLLWTDNYHNALINVMNYVYLLLVIAALTSLQEKFLSKIIFGFATGILLLLFLSVLNYFEIVTVFGAGFRTASLFMSRLEYSMFIGWSVVLGLYTLSEKSNPKNLAIYVFWTIFTILNFVWIFVQDGRIGQLAFIVTLPILLYFILKKSKRRYFLLTLFLFILVLGLEFTYNRTFSERINRVNQEFSAAFEENYYNTSIGTRIVTIKLALFMISKSPFIGYGVGDAIDELLNFYNIQNKGEHISDTMNIILNTHLHNQYLQILVETGFIGFFLFLMMFWSFYKEAEFKRIAILLIVFFFTGFMVEPFLHKQFSSALICLFMSIFYKNNKVDLEKH